MKIDIDPCKICGTWECLDCGAKMHERNRFYPGQHRCTKCKSGNGQMLPMRHRNHYKRLDHDGEYQELLRRYGEPRYSL